MKCDKCSNKITEGSFHDCLGIHDLERYAAHQPLPRSARKRLMKTFGLDFYRRDPFYVEEEEVDGRG